MAGSTMMWSHKETLTRVLRLPLEAVHEDGFTMPLGDGPYHLPTVAGDLVSQVVSEAVQGVSDARLRSIVVEVFWATR